MCGAKEQWKNRAIAESLSRRASVHIVSECRKFIPASTWKIQPFSQETSKKTNK
jgi:hypothetical protein